MHSRIQTYYITTGKDQSLNVHGRHQTNYKKLKEWEALIHAVRIYSRDMTDRQIELSNQEKIECTEKRKPRIT